MDLIRAVVGMCGPMQRSMKGLWQQKLTMSDGVEWRATEVAAAKDTDPLRYTVVAAPSGILVLIISILNGLYANNLAASSLVTTMRSNGCLSYRVRMKKMSESARKHAMVFLGVGN